MSKSQVLGSVNKKSYVIDEDLRYLSFFKFLQNL